MSEIDATTVLVLAQAQGHDWVDAETAARIAAGAAEAVAAVRASLARHPGALFDTDHADFLAVLESLAEHSS